MPEAPLSIGNGRKPPQAEVSSSGQDVELRIPPNSRIPEGAPSPIEVQSFRLRSKLGV